MDGCSYPAHGPSYWRAPDQTIIVCGRCHPPPVTACNVQTRAEGWFEAGHWKPVERHPAPFAQEARVIPFPTARSTMVTLTRPTRPEDARAFYARLAKALDDLGVTRGESFTIMPAPTAQTLMDVNHRPGDALTGG